MLIRKKLTADEFSIPYLRYNEGCDCVQFTPDGGTTWIDQPANDPRTSDAYRLPALTGTDRRCRAAEGMTALIRQMVNARISDITDAELAGTILGIVAFIPGFNILWALILAFVSLAFTIAREILEAAFTEAVYDEIRCIFECAISIDGQMSQAQFDEAYANMTALDAVAETWCKAVMDLVGAVGMSDAGVALEAAADCDCHCCDEGVTITFDDLTCVTFSGFTGYGATTLDNAIGNPAPSAKGAAKLSGFGTAAGVRIEVGALLTQATFDWRYTRNAGGSSVFFRTITLYSAANVVLANFNSSTLVPSSTWRTETVTYAGAVETSYIVVQIGVEGSGTAGTCNIDNITMTLA